MVQGRNARYSLKYYFVWEGLIYLRYKDIGDAFRLKCVDSVACEF